MGDDPLLFRSLERIDKKSLIKLLHCRVYQFSSFATIYQIS